MRLTWKICALIGALVLGTTACGEVIDEEPTGGEVVVQGELENHMSDPIVVINDLYERPALAFGFTQEDGWHWVRRENAVFPKALERSAIASAQLAGDDLFDAFDVGDSMSGGAISFSAAAAGNTSFGASFRTSPLFSATPATTNFRAETAPNIDYSPTLGSGGSAVSCSLTSICDFAARACNLASGFGEACPAGTVNQCYSAVYNIAIPAELGPFICALISFLDCLLAYGEAAVAGESFGGTCGIALPGFDVNVGEPEPEMGPDFEDPFDNPDFEF